MSLTRTSPLEPHLETFIYCLIRLCRVLLSRCLKEQRLLGCAYSLPPGPQSFLLGNLEILAWNDIASCIDY